MSSAYMTASPSPSPSPYSPSPYSPPPLSPAYHNGTSSHYVSPHSPYTPAPQTPAPPTPTPTPYQYYTSPYSSHTSNGNGTSTSISTSSGLPTSSLPTSSPAPPPATSTSTSPFPSSSSSSSPSPSAVVLVDDSSSILRAVNSCPDCKTSDFIYDEHQARMICEHCGMIVQDSMISDESEWRTFADGDKEKDDPNRVGGIENPLLEGMGLSTIIANDPSGGLSFSKYQNKGQMNSTHRSLTEAFRRTTRMAGTLSLPKTIVDRSNEIYTRVETSKQLKSRKMEAVITACLYFACRQEKVPRTLKELCGAAGLEVKLISRVVSKIKKLKLYKIKGAPSTSLAGTVKPTTAAESAANRAEKKVNAAPDSSAFLDRWCNQLKLPQSVTKAATYIAEKAAANRYGAGKTPGTLASAAIYMACKLSADPLNRKSTADIGRVTFIAPNTIRATFKQDFYEHRAKLIPTNYATTAQIMSMTND